MVFDTVLVDLHNVLFFVSSFDERQRKTLSSIRQTLAWLEYEKGFLDQKEAYKAISLETEDRISVDTIEKLLDEGHSLLYVQDMVFNMLKLLKTTHGCRLFALSNISKADYESLQSRFGDILNELFEKVFTSYAYGDRKPSLSLFRRVLVDIDRNANHVVFIDDEIDNVVAAASLGIKSIHARKKDLKNQMQILYNLCRHDPCYSGVEFVQRHAGRHVSMRSDGEEIEENFSQMLLYEITRDISLTKFVLHDRLFHFFQNPLSVATFPFDLDTTSIGLTVTDHVPEPVVHSILDEILSKYINQEGIVQVYFDERRPRTDPNAAVNVLTLFYAYGRGNQLSDTEKWVFDVLFTRAYNQGTRYYPLPECFLFFLTRLFKRAPEVKRRMLPIFRERVEESLYCHDKDSLAIALGLLAAHSAGLKMMDKKKIKTELEKLRMLQQVDGSWESLNFCSYGSSDIKIGNKGLTTALAVKALRLLEQEEQLSGETFTTKAITAFESC